MALKIIYRIRSLKIIAFLSFVLTFTLLSCSQNKTPIPSDEAVVAKVGDQAITAKEFRNNYEAGFAHLKTGNDPKETYLNYMINEKLLAFEGYQLGLDETAYVEKNEQRLLNELKVETLLDKEVKSKIKITPEEIRQEINKSKVSFKFRYWVEPTLEKASAVAEDMRKRGYAEVMNDIMNSNPERKITPAIYETDYLTYLEVPDEVLNAIKNLPYGDISEPLELNDKYFIFQVLDIRRSGITENEYKDRASRFEEIIFYRKFQEEAAKYTADLMQPKNVVTKGEAFNLLEHAINEWLKIKPGEKAHFAEQVRNAADDHPAIEALKDKLNSTFFTYENGQLSIDKFLPFFNQSRFLRQLKEKNELRDALNQEVKNAIRDYFFVRQAEKLNLENTPKVQKEFKLWRDKWVFDEMLHRLTEDHKEELHYAGIRSKADTYRHQANLLLEQEVESLRKRYPVIINHAVLDTITVIDFKKSHWANIQIFKGGTNRPALPVVDPFWEPPKSN